MNEKILVVDDHPTTLKLMTKLLENNGYQVYTAEDGFKALNMLSSIKPDIIFMDLIMPKISGDILCRVIRKMPDLVDCYIVIVSAVVAEQHLDLEEIGADACIAKNSFGETSKYILEAISYSQSKKKECMQAPVFGLENVHARRITKELLSQNLHLKTILESMSEGILELYHDRIVYANSAAITMLGATQERLLGAYLPDLLNSNMKPKIESMIKSNHKEVSKISADDPVEINGRQLTMKQQQLKGDSFSTIILIKDVTERKRMESIAAAANLMDNIGFIFSGIRHEIGNPLNSIKMALTVLKKNVFAYNRETIMDFIDRGLTEIFRIEYLLKALKNFSLFEKPDIQKIRMDHFLQNYLSLVRSDFENRGIEIKSDLSSDVKWVHTDPRALHHILLNIFTNAADASENQKHPQIVISIRRQNHCIEIQIKDNGCGISEEDQMNLFKPFFTSKHHGTGLGLVIIKKMLSKMNSTIQIQSYKDFGTTVSISIPERFNHDKR